MGARLPGSAQITEDNTRRSAERREEAMRTLPWVNLCLGFWLTGAPLILGFRENGIPAVNDVVVGLLLVGTAAATLYLEGSKERRTPDEMP